jgi:hypothetical protein
VTWGHRRDNACVIRAFYNQEKATNSGAMPCFGAALRFQRSPLCLSRILVLLRGSHEAVSFLVAVEQLRFIAMNLFLEVSHPRFLELRCGHLWGSLLCCGSPSSSTGSLVFQLSHFLAGPVTLRTTCWHGGHCDKRCSWSHVGLPRPERWTS